MGRLLCSCFVGIRREVFVSMLAAWMKACTTGRVQVPCLGQTSSRPLDGETRDHHRLIGMRCLRGTRLVSNISQRSFGDR